MDGAYLFTRSHRTHRAAEWSPGKAVTFIVTLAATRNVTLAARAAGMSRKSAYALRARDFAFAAAWDAALAACRKGDEVDEVDEPPISSNRGDRRAEDERRRDTYFARLARTCSAPRSRLD